MSRYISLKLDIVATDTGWGWQIFHRSSGSNQSIVGIRPFPVDISADSIKRMVDNSISSGGLTQLRACGAEIYGKIFPKEIFQEIESSDSGDILFVVPPEWADIPFEIIYTSRGYLGCLFKVGTIINVQSGNRPENKHCVASGSLLIISDPAGDIASAREEGFALKEVARKDGKQVHLLLSADKSKICHAIEDSSIVHFCGHSFCTDDAQTGGWQISSNTLFDLSDMEFIGTRPTVPWIVFSNSCYGGDCGGKENLSGIAGAFLKAGVAQVIGPIAKINDQEALSFARLFYGHLFKGQMPSSALLGAKQKTEGRHINSCSHLFYRLYGDPCYSPPIFDSNGENLIDNTNKPRLRRAIIIITIVFVLFIALVIILTGKCDENNIMYFPASQHSYYDQKPGKDINLRYSYINGNSNGFQTSTKDLR